MLSSLSRNYLSQQSLKKGDGREIPDNGDAEECFLHRAAEVAITPTDPDDAEEKKRVPRTAKAIARGLDDKPKRVEDARDHLKVQRSPSLKSS